jgi:hypothetical protein
VSEERCPKCGELLRLNRDDILGVPGSAANIEWNESRDRRSPDMALLRKVDSYWADTEARSAEAHAAYQAEAHRRGDVRHHDNYDDLPDSTKEWDRVLVRWVRESIARVLAEEATGQAPDGEG